MKSIFFLLLLASPLFAEQDIIEAAKTINTEAECSVCKETIIGLQGYFSNAIHYESARLALKEICFAFILPNLEECNGIVENFNGIISEIFARKIFDPDLICNSMNKCSSPIYKKENFNDIINIIDKETFTYSEYELLMDSILSIF